MERMVKQPILLIFFFLLNSYAITKTACNNWKCGASYKPKHTHPTDVGQTPDFFFLKEEFKISMKWHVWLQMTKKKNKYLYGCD